MLPVKKKIIIISIIVLIILVVSLIIYFNTRIVVDNSGFTLKDDLTVNVYSDVKVKDFIKDIDGKAVDEAGDHGINHESQEENEARQQEEIGRSGLPPHQCPAHAGLVRLCQVFALL